MSDRHRTSGVMLGPRPLPMRPRQESDALATWATFGLALLIFLAGYYAGVRSNSTTTATEAHAHAPTP